MTRADVYIGEGDGIDVRAYPDGLRITGFFDSFVGIEGGFLTWAEIEALRTKARRRIPYRQVLE